jgi:GNAT superfamily N-acetyltransferase
MFRDMGLLDESETKRLHKASRPWIEDQLQNGMYVGWFVQCNEFVVAGCGLHLSAFGPKPGFSEGGKSAHVANVYVEASHRRRGLADELMATALQWARTQDIREMTLSASEQAKSLYQRLGFTHDAARHVLKL